MVHNQCEASHITTSHSSSCTPSITPKRTPLEFVFKSLFSLFGIGISLQFLILFGSYLCIPADAHAITIDNFQGTQSVSSNGSSNVTSFSSVNTAGAIGGTRSINTTATGGNAGLTVTATTTSATPFFYNHSQDATVTAISNIHWDGDNTAASVNFTGLNGIDLTEDGANAFVFDGVFYDFPSGANTTITVTVYDASDSTGATFTEFDLVLSQAHSGSLLTLPFSAIANTGPGGAAVLTNVGAIVLTVNGNSPDVDLIIDLIGTNGTCTLIPGVGEGVIDECGVCIAESDPMNNQSCADCEGVPNGSALPGNSCDTGELGPCEAGTYDSSCSCIRNVDPLPERCDGLDNNCNGEADEIFPQLGDNCGVFETGCEFTGVFTCTASGAVRCDADISEADLSQCSDIIGCDGIPGSDLVNDACGVCGGDGSTCADLPCESESIFDQIAELDGGVKDQEQLVRSITHILRLECPRRRIRLRSREQRIEAREVQINSWVEIWTAPTSILTCDLDETADVCVETSHQDIIDEYIAGSERLEAIGRVAARRLRRCIGNVPAQRRWRKRVRRQHARNLALAQTLPTSTATCNAI